MGAHELPLSADVLPAGDTGPARDLLAALAAEGVPGASTLLDGALVLEAELGGRHAAMSPCALDWLATRGTPFDALADRLAGAARGNPGLEAGLGALVVRALAPFASLSTWPFEALFTPAEAEVLRATAPSPAPVEVPGAIVRRGQPVAYGGQISLILKATRRCNLRCGYCADWRESGESMAFDTYRPVFADLIASGRWSRIDFIWHGGEPTLIGRRALLRMLAVQQHYARPGQAIGNSMQTNGTTVTPRLARLLAHLGIGVSLSLDGMETVHDRRRPDRRGRGSWGAVIAGLGHLRAAGLSPAALVVVGRETVDAGPLALLQSLTAIGVTRAGLLVERPPHEAAPAVEPVPLPEFHRFLIALHRLRRADPRLWVDVREIDEPLTLLRGGTARHCELLGACQGAVLSIEPGGRVSHCDKYLDDPDYVLGQSVAEAVDGPRVQALRAADTAELDGLRACPHFQLCQGWCPHERALSRRIGDRAAGCCGLRALFDGLAEVERAHSPDLAGATDHGRVS